MTYRIVMSHENDPHSWNDHAVEDTLADCRERFIDHVALIARYTDESTAYAYVYVDDADCPDWKLSVGARGGIKKEKV